MVRRRYVSVSLVLGLALVLASSAALPSPQETAEKRPKDQAEYELINKVYKETDPLTKLQYISEWSEKYPSSDYWSDRLRLAMRTFQQFGDGKSAVRVAQALLDEFPGDFEANFTIATLTPSLDSTDATVLSTGEEAASSLISAGKPSTLTDDQWGQVKKRVLTTSHQTLGWIHMQRKDNVKAEQEFMQVLDMIPNVAQVSYWLGNVVSAQGDPDKIELALFSFARAAAYSGEGALPDAGRQKVHEHLKVVYREFVGSEVGLAELMELASSRPLPPFDLKIQRQETSPQVAEASDGEFDFRRARWSQSLAEVRATEEAAPVEETETALGYAIEVAGFEGIAVYSFIDDKLATAVYNFVEKHSDDSAYLSDASTLAGLLGRKYGSTEGEFVWHNDLYRDDPQKHGLAVSAGHLERIWRWRTPRTDIELKLSGDNFDVSLMIVYRSRELRKIQQEAAISEELDKL